MIKFSRGQWICHMVNLVLFIIGSILLAAGLLFWLTFFPKIMKNTIEKKKIIQTDSDGKLNEFTHDWLHMNYTVYFQYWFYNYSNPWEIVDHGTYPDVFEKGPYSYKETITYNYTSDSWSNYDYDFTYFKTTDYIFDHETSCRGCTEDDEFMLPDMAFFGLADKMLDRDQICQILQESNFPAFPEHCNDTYTPPSVFEIKEFFSTFVSLYSTGPFISVKVREILFDGYEDPIFTRMMPEMEKDMPTLFQIMQNHSSVNLTVTPMVRLNKNPKDTSTYTVSTGKGSWNTVGSMKLFNGQDQLPEEWWNGFDQDSIYCPPEQSSKARYLAGTTGDFFQPVINKTSVLTAFNEDICRSLNFVYQNESSVRDIDTYRFVVDSNGFKNSNPENCGYCRQLARDMYGRKAGSYCLPDGLLDISGCQYMNTPIAVSNPHFYDADVLVQLMYSRFKPNETYDQTFLDIEPNTGTVLAAQKKLQINFITKNYPGSAFAYLPAGVYPIAWVNETYMMDDQTYNMLKTDLINPRNLVKLLCFIVGVGLGSALIVYSIVATFVNICYFTKRPSTTLNQNHVNHINDEIYPPVHSIQVSDDMQVQQRIRSKAPTLD